MPIECERLQGFPAIIDRVRIAVWHHSDLPASGALAETQSPKSQKSALSAAGSGSPRPVCSAETNFVTNRHGHDLPVALNVLINLEDGKVRLSNAGKLLWSASTAIKSSESPLPMPVDAFARLVARMTQTEVPQTLSGRVELPANTSNSSPALLGSACVDVFGQETEELASDAARLTTAAENFTKSTTSGDGSHSQSCDLSLGTLNSCVTAAISSCIPNEIRLMSSYAVCVDLIRAYTDVPYRNKPAVDGPRYKALGNSMAVNCMRWLGRRIEMVDALASSTRSKEPINE
jgi:DNA (cytosine-5)-methyltransferase 1